MPDETERDALPPDDTDGMLRPYDGALVPYDVGARI